MVYLEISLDVLHKDRAAAVAIYSQFKPDFLEHATGAVSKDLLVRKEDVQVLHVFSSMEAANAYLGSSMFNGDVVTALKPLLQGPPDVRVYVAA